MKRTISAMLAALVCAVACTTTGPVSEPKLNVEGLSLGTGNEVVVPAAGLDVTFSITSNLGYTVTSSQSWASVTPAAVSNEDGKDVKTAVTVAVAANETAEAREAVIKVVTEKNPALDYSFTVKQSAGKEPVSFYVTTTDLHEITAPIEVAEKATSASVIVVSNVSWTASSDQTWLTVSPASATIENEEVPTRVSFTVEANSVTEVRTANVTFTAEGAEPVVVSVSQAAKKFYTFELSVSDITASGAVINVVPSDKDVIYNVSVFASSKFSEFETLGSLISYDLASLEEYVSGKGSTLGSYFTEYGYSGDVEDDWRGYLDSETDYTAVVYAVEIEGDNVSAYVDGAKTIAFKTLSWSPAEGLVAATSKNDYLGSWYLVGKDFYAEDPENPYLVWQVELTDGGNDGKYDYVTVNNFLPYNSTAMPDNSYNLIYKDGILYMAPGVVPYTDQFIYKGAAYDLELYCMNTGAGEISPNAVMCGGFVEIEGVNCVSFASEPGQTFVSDGFYISIPAMNSALFAVSKLSLQPVPESSSESKVSKAVSDKVSIYPALNSFTPKRVRK